MHYTAQILSKNIKLCLQILIASFSQVTFMILVIGSSNELLYQ